MKHLVATLLALGSLAGCVETSQPKSVAMGASAGKTATETLAEMTPEAAAPMFARFAGPDAKRNENGEIEVVLGTGNADTMPTIRKAGTVICESMQLQFVDVAELPRKDGARKILVRCK